jgi:hypothetical protein
MLRLFSVALLLGAMCSTCPCRALERGPLLESLRPAVREDLVSYELGPLEDLPAYDLDLTLRDDLAAYDLRETIEYTNQTGAALPDVVLRIFANVTGHAPAAVSLVSAHCQEQACALSQPHPSAIRLRLAAALPVGARIHIMLVLRGSLRQIAAANTDLLSQGALALPALLGRGPDGDYGLLSVGEGIATLSHFYAVVAQRVDQQWLFSAQKPFGDPGAGGLGFVRASVHAPKAVRIICSGISSLVSADAVHSCRAALVRDFALVASRVLMERTRQVGDIRVRSHFLPAHAAAGERVLDTAAHALAVFEEHFGGYPYRDLDVVEAPLVGGAGGAEFSGLVSVASMLYQPLTAAGQNIQPLASLLEFTTAHEVAHQYWYGLVGSDARAHPFQDEALTQWSAGFYFERRYGAARAARESDAQIALNYRFMRVLGHPDGAVDRPVDAFDSALTYTGLVYGKAAFVYPALRKLVGDALFFNALRSYVLRYRFRSADKYALFDIVAELSGRGGKVRALVQRWLVQAHGDRDLGVDTDQGPALSQGSPDERHRMQLLLTALAAASGSPTGSAPSAKPGANTPSAEQLNTLLQNLTGTETNDASLEQLRGALGGATGAPGQSPEVMHELSSSTNEQGL